MAPLETRSKRFQPVTCGHEAAGRFSELTTTSVVASPASHDSRHQHQTGGFIMIRISFLGAVLCPRILACCRRSTLSIKNLSGLHFKSNG